jgi:predicted outer membrane protein
MVSSSLVSQLQAAAEPAFDEFYVTSQVVVHQQVLAILDEELIPEADNADLMEYLDTVRDSVAAHLQVAEELLEELD